MAQSVPSYPVPKQSHVYDPAVLVHVPLLQGDDNEHSSTSIDKVKEKWKHVYYCQFPKM